MNKVLIHESGNVTLMQGSFQIEIKKADGTVDPVVTTKEAANLTDAQFSEKLNDPAKYNLKKFTGRIIEEPLEN